MAMTTTNEEVVRSQESGLLKLKYLDYVELYVGNPFQATHFFRTAVGFTPIAYAGLETKVRDRASYVVAQGKVRLVLTGGLEGSSPISEYVKIHGDSVKDVAFAVDDAEHAFEVAVSNGAQPVMEPTVFEDEDGRIVKATIAAYGETVHSFVQRGDYQGAFLPGYAPITNPAPSVSTGLIEIDHVAIGMEQGRLDEWVEFYKRVLSFHEMHEEMISTEHSSMNSKVVEDSTGQIKFPIVEPAPSAVKRRSQIDEYLTYHNGPGAQHIAFLTNDILTTVRTWRENGVGFVHTPDAYYELLEGRVGKLGSQMVAALCDQRIMVDRDDWGTLMQIFSKPIQCRPTLFLEVIQRDGARGFGGGNIKALFEAVEREQALRGNI
jgi:4-hydroxyphenylpyruvate dioxygenase